MSYPQECATGHPLANPSLVFKPALRVRGLLFDMGDVLYDATLWRRWLLQLLARMGIHASYRAFYRVWDRDYLPAVHRGQRDYHEAFCAYLQSLGLSRGVIEEIEAASQARRRELIATLRPLPGVRATLGQLQATGLALAVLSDSESPAKELRERLDRLGIDRCFHSVHSSRDLGVNKPAGLAYRTALAALRLPAEEVAFVGHDAEELAGAAAVGMPTIAFNYDPDVTADLYVKRFEELLEFVACRAPIAVAV